MSRRDDARSMRDMLDHAREAVELAAGKTLEDVLSNRTLELALVRLVEVVGEASRRVSAETRAKHPEIQWRMSSDTRNRLIHGYDEISLPLVWDIIEESLPALIAELERILDE